MSSPSKRPRVREAGIEIGSLSPGPKNSILDVPGVAVGHTTLVEGDGALVVGKGPVRTGVTAVLPHGGNLFREKVRGAVHVINGFGKATGLAQVQELGVIETPIVLTNTLSVGTAWDALCEYMLAQNEEIGTTTGTVNPLVAECNDGYLNDIRGRHVKREHVLSALTGASTEVCPEGNVGAGTGMSCLGFKGGIGTSSRRLTGDIEDRFLGVLVLANFGSLRDLLIAGVPVGALLADRRVPDAPPGSVVVVIGTDAPLSDRQLGRIARRAQAGLAKVGSVFSNGSGDFAIAFSTEGRVSHSSQGMIVETRLRDDSKEMAAVFRATVEAVEEAVLNALFAAKSMIGRDGNAREGLPVDEVRSILVSRGVIK
ncbi:MAG: P1 family peptidase [Bacillota bacterium]|jgi:D-aminopeptidase|nr:P1 family peptidase [Candidatus Fermentithermobacillaceae bacterium]